MDRHLPVREVFRKDVKSRVTNSYRRREKYLSGTQCPECGLIFSKGAWKWPAASVGRMSQSKKCPACLQIQDDFPGGVLKLRGSFLKGHRKELLRCVRNAERTMQAEHPLGRIFRTKELREEIILYSTTEHLVSRLGKALRDAFGGELVLRYGPGIEMANARWRRDD
jgi:NMD protein affecting ribosome stability and mRNA decay